MNAVAGLSQQILSASKHKTPEKDLSRLQANGDSNKFDRNLKKYESKDPQGKAPVSKDYSVESRKSSSPEKTITEKRIEERASEKAQDSRPSESKSLTKQEAMWAFLDRMNQELGVQPDEVMNAFAKLDVDNLVAPPEESADEFVQNLDIDPAKQEQALGLYSQLLTWTSAASLSEQLQQQGQNADLNVINSQEYQQKQRLAGLNDLSDKFFMNGNHSRDNILQSRDNMNGFAQQGGMGLKGSDLADRMFNQQSASQQVTSQQAAVGSTDELVRQLQAESDSFSKADMTQLELQQKLNALKTYSQPNPLNQQPVAVLQQNLNMMNMNSMEALETAEMDFEPTQAIKANDTTAFADASGEGEAQMNMEGEGEAFATQNSSLNKTTATTGADFMVKAPQPTETEMSENIRDIINKAQVMVKDGGGEMKISLRPEGMGNVNLKVNVTGGNVNVEMITASDETRKALEKGLGDLKDNLSLQKLNVDQIKVESMQDTADKLMEQKQEQAERHFQERFLQEFTGQNSSRRSGAFGLPVGRPESQGAETIEQSDEDRTQKSRRLDLVA